MNAYSARKGEFENAKRKKFGLQNVLEDLESQGVLVSVYLNLNSVFYRLISVLQTKPTTPTMLQVKLKNLLLAWKTVKDNNR